MEAFNKAHQTWVPVDPIVTQTIGKASKLEPPGSYEWNQMSYAVAFESDAKPRLVGLSTPFFASNPPLESPNSQSAAMQRVEAEATKRGDKVKVLVAEDNKVSKLPFEGFPEY